MSGVDIWKERADFIYEVDLRDPKKAKDLKDRGNGRSRGGYSKHVARQWDASQNRYKRFSRKDEVKYRANRANFHDELSMLADTNGITDIFYEIRKNSKWTFDETPFSFLPATGLDDVIAWKTLSAHAAVIRVIGAAKARNDTEINYHLNFRDENGDPVTHDPRIKNDLGVPFIGSLALFDNNIKTADEELILLENFLSEVEDLGR